MLFGNMITGEVHPQSHISVFGDQKKYFFFVGPTNFRCRATGLEKQHFADSHGDFQ
jgi:hypothetical protein